MVRKFGGFVKEFLLSTKLLNLLYGFKGNILSMESLGLLAYYLRVLKN
ncbi:hypothetical protein wVul_0742 [Wolbachia endosymbiont of Armadillidium vulgare str. wVulC]|nr:hypothetical protein wVul_0742 [Wolbachia endosymbiont of Armadillidium vulgare str. wVulC]